MKRTISSLLVLFFFAQVISASEITYPKEVSPNEISTEVMWQAIRRLPKNERPRIVLVLGGGGARGLSHIGVLRALEQQQVPVDAIVGVSVGALIGSLYSAGLSLDQIELMANDIGWNKLTNFSKIRVMILMLTKSLFSTKRMETYLDHYIGGKNFRELSIPFTCIATDLRTGERVVFDEGPVALAARASATIPGIFSPVEYRHRSLVDGGLVDNLPVDLARAKNPDTFVIGVLPKSGSQNSSYDSTFGALIRAIEIQKDFIIESKKNAADFLIEPELQHVSIADLSKNRECIDAGLLATRKNMDALKRKIMANILTRRGITAASRAK